MADPKHVRIRGKVREISERRTLGEETAVPYRVHQPNDSFDPRAAPLAPSKPHPGHKIGDLLDSRPPAESNGVSHSAHPKDEPRPAGGFAAVNSSWSGVNSVTQHRPQSRDQNMPDAPPIKPPTDQPPASAQGPFWSTWRTPDDQSRVYSQTPTAQMSPSRPSTQEVQHSNNTVADSARTTTVTGPKPDNTPSAQTQPIVEPSKDTGARTEKENSRHPTPAASVQKLEPTAPETNTEDTPMSGTEKTDLKVDTETRPAHSQQQSKASSTAPEKLDKEPKVAVVEVTNRGTPDGNTEETEPPQPSTPAVKAEPTKSALQSPEAAQKRGPGPAPSSRRGSRRSSTAAALKAAEEEQRTSPTTSERAKDEDQDDDDDDGDNIIVATSPRPTERKELERTKPETRRQANGRFVRSGRRFGASS